MRLVSEKISSIDDALSNEFQVLVTMETDEIHHTACFERLLTSDGESVKIYRRGSSIFFIFRYNNYPEILDKILILFKNGIIYLIEAFLSSFSEENIID